MTKQDRAPLRCPLDEHDLNKAPLAAVLRLAKFLGIDTAYKPRDTTVGSYRHRITLSILRWEKFYSKGVKKPKTWVTE